MIRVALAEDDTQIAEIQSRYLSRIDGFELVGIAHSPTDALDIVEVLQPDLLLLDIFFPDGNGLDLLRELRHRSLNTDVILITAAQDVSTLKAALHGGVFDYILKPLVFDRLKATLQRYREHHNELLSLSAIGQADLDTMLAHNNQRNPNLTPNAVSEAVQRLPKGIDGITLEKIREVFNQAQEKLSAEEVGSHIGASRTTARRYLEYLTTTNELVAQVEYGTVGRPERKYSQPRTKAFN